MLPVPKFDKYLIFYRSTPEGLEIVRVVRRAGSSVFISLTQRMLVFETIRKLLTPRLDGRLVVVLNQLRGRRFFAVQSFVLRGHWIIYWCTRWSRRKQQFPCHPGEPFRVGSPTRDGANG
jgi:hypothetical protein